jgi:hypothetical protein
MSKTRSTVLIAVLVAVALSAGLLLGLSGGKGGRSGSAAFAPTPGTTAVPTRTQPAAVQPETVVVVQPASQPVPAQAQPEPQPQPTPTRACLPSDRP